MLARAGDAALSRSRHGGPLRPTAAGSAHRSSNTSGECRFNVPIRRSCTMCYACSPRLHCSDRSHGSTATHVILTPSPSAGCRLLIEAPRGVSNSSTTSVIQVDSNGSKLLRAGALDESTLARWNATLILFICTGNTCRSPMAEALCKVLLAERIGCEPSQLAEPRIRRGVGGRLGHEWHAGRGERRRRCAPAGGRWRVIGVAGFRTI